jgi:hypothetical protein
MLYRVLGGMERERAFNHNQLLCCASTHVTLCKFGWQRVEPNRFQSDRINSTRIDGTRSHGTGSDQIAFRWNRFEPVRTEFQSMFQKQTLSRDNICRFLNAPREIRTERIFSEESSDDEIGRSFGQCKFPMRISTGDSYSVT